MIFQSEKLIKSFNILGQENNLKGLVIDIFNDGLQILNT